MYWRRFSFIFIGVVILAIIGIAIWFLRTQTAFLSPKPSPAAVKQNNENPTTNTTNTSQPVTTELRELAAKTVSVPDRFRTGVFAKERTLNLPADWSVSVFASGLDAPRFFDIDSAGSLIVADKGAGELVLLPDADQDGVADATKVIYEGLRNVHSVDLLEGNLYVGEEHQVSVYRQFKADGSFQKKEVILGLPAGGGHVTRTVLIGPDNKLYVSVGSSCNLCEEKDERRAAVLVTDLDGQNSRVLAKGLRNSVGLAFHGNDLWSVDNGRDLLGDNLPPEEVNIIQEGKHYGWPYCYGHGLANPEYDERANFCRTETEPPVFSMQAHSAPLGMAFAPTDTLPGLSGKLVVTFHGSWNRTEKTGYKLIWVDPEKNGTDALNLISGWLDSGGNVWGRPVGVGFDSEGIMYISDDQAGAIYRVSSLAR